MPQTSDSALTSAARGLTPADMDRRLHAWQGRFTGGLSPNRLGLALVDWLAHAANTPFQTAALSGSAATQWRRLFQAALDGETAIAPRPGDHRFSHAAWSMSPYDLLIQSVLLGEEWWESVTQSPAGVGEPNRRILAFHARQVLDLLSPSNAPWLNAEVVAATQASCGQNLVNGFVNYICDRSAAIRGQKAPSGFTLGVDLAATPGKVVFRNALIELIQYAPTAETVGAEPLLIAPAWIMKYYILDLSAQNSMVRWLADQGRTVFMMSWRNPDAAMADTSLDDYRRLGVMAAIDAVAEICGGAKIHAVGYCLGGTLLTIAAAAMARDQDDRLQSLTLLAAQTDFTDAGDLKLFITEDQLSFLDDIMKTQGFLDSTQMAGAFQMLQANDLVWSHAIKDYLLGETEAPFDLMAWNADGTRMPARMHIEYLRRLFLDNDLAEGRFDVNGRPLALENLKLPMFVVGAERDLIAPWRSVFKLHLQTPTALTFVLASGGHNAGIVSEPGHPRRHFRLRRRERESETLGPDAWLAETKPQDGSWWTEWDAWLGHGTLHTAPPRLGDATYPPLCDAPGVYVKEG